MGDERRERRAERVRVDIAGQQRLGGHDVHPLARCHARLPRWAGAVATAVATAASSAIVWWRNSCGTVTARPARLAMAITWMPRIESPHGGAPFKGARKVVVGMADPFSAPPR